MTTPTTFTLWPLAYDPVRVVIERARQGTADVLDRVKSAGPYDPVPAGTTTVFTKTYNANKAFFAAWDGIEGALVSLAAKVLSINIADQYTLRARTEQIAVAINDARATTNAQLDTMRTTYDKLRAVLEAAALPPRPPADDPAAQEVAINGIKVDLRMLFDSRGGEALLTAMSDEADRRYTGGDPLGGWVIAATDWPELYLRSRQMEALIDLWNVQVRPDLIRRSVVGVTKAAADLLAVAKAPNGMAGALLCASELRDACFDYLATPVSVG